MTSESGAPVTRMLAGVVAAWTVVALVAGGQTLLAERLAGQAISAAQAFTRHLPLLALWALVTPAVLRSARRFPVRGDGRWNAALLHAGLGTLFIVTANLAIRLPGLLPGGPLDGPGELLRSTVAGLARWYPLAFVVYGVIVAVGHGLVARSPGDGFHRRHRRARDGLTDGNPIPLRIGSALRLVEPTEVEWVEADGNYVLFHDVNGRTHRLRSSLRAIEDRLAPEGFARLHRSALVRVSAIREVRPVERGDFEVVLRGGDRVPLPRTRRRELESLLGVEL